MTNREVWAACDFYTSEITKHARAVGFGGLAVCWFFRSAQVSFPSLIVLAMIGLMVFFLLDLGQYYVAAVRLRSGMRREEVRRESEAGSIEGDYALPAALDTPSFILFHVKLSFLLAGLTAIGAVLVRRLR